MSLLRDLAVRAEHLIYDQLCNVSELILDDDDGRYDDPLASASVPTKERRLESSRRAA